MAGRLNCVLTLLLWGGTTGIPVDGNAASWGGTGLQQSNAAITDTQGNTWIVGFTDAPDFPEVDAAFSFSGGVDAFVVKLDPSGNVLLSTCLGGTGDDRATTIGLDADGNVYVAGTTTSALFDGVPLSGRSANSDGFIVKLAPDAHSILYAVALGGGQDDGVNGMAVLSDGTVYVTGETSSPDLPVRNALQTALHGSSNAFAAKVTPAGTITYCTYLGGGAVDVGEAIAVDGGGAVWIVGSTTSTNFPLASPLRGALSGNEDAFITRFDPDGGSLVFSTYFGGSGGQLGLREYATSVAVDSAGNAYVTGVTSSTDFPVLHAWQSQFFGWDTDVFLSSFTPAGGLRFSTYLGGSASDFASSVGILADNRIVLGGWTLSNDFPVTDTAIQWHGGGYNGFLAVFDPLASSLLYGTYVNQGSSDSVSAVTNAIPPVAVGITTRQSAPGATLATAVQIGIPACCQLTSTSTTAPASGGTISVRVTAPDGCSWTATSNASWLAILSGNSGTGNGTVSFSVVINMSTSSRVGTLTIAGQTFTVTQVGSGSAVLSITKRHLANFTLGQTEGAYYVVIVSNAANAGSSHGTVSVTDAIPAGLTLASMAGSGWTCLGNTCSRGDSLSAGASYPAITMNVSVAADAPPQLTNHASVSGGGSADATVADPTAIEATLATGVSPAGAGSVAISPPSSTGTYSPGTRVCLTAIPASGWAFSSWSGATLDSSNCFSITVNTTVTASFHCATCFTLDQQKQYFGATNSGAVVTPPQKVQVTASPGVSWSVSSNQPYLVVSPTSGTGSGSFTVSIQSTTLPSPSTQQGTITVTAPSASNSPQTVQVSVKVVNSSATGSPFGSFDTPANNTTGISGSIAVTGWALDNIGVQTVQIWRNPIGSEPTASNGLVYIGDATFVPGARPDVQSAYASYPLNNRAGWGYLMLTNGLPNNGGSAGTGNGTYVLHAIATSIDGKTFELGTKTITCDNGDATIPFGAIDTPGQGETVSGTIVNFGWALTPQPYSIPTDGSTITVTVDGVTLGHPVYNQYRSDIATGFPGYANANGAVGYFSIDTTTLSNGIHTIGWLVYDNDGKGAGIGSRFFWVQN